MKQRDQVAMSPGEVAALLAEGRKLQLATINQDGTPHLVAMFYTMIGGQIAFWTYRSSLKARNLARDPRLSCLVEAGEEYFELRGVQVSGAARCVADPGGVLDIGRRIMAGLSGVPGRRGGGVRGPGRAQAGGVHGGTGPDRLLGSPQAAAVRAGVTQTVECMNSTESNAACLPSAEQGQVVC